MAKLRTLSASSFDPKLRLRIQSSGKIGFGDEVIQSLELSESTYMKFSIDDDARDTLLYITILRSPNKEAFQVKKAGKYFNLNTSRMFDSLDVDYANKTIFLNMVRKQELDGELGGETYRLKFEVKQKNSSDTPDMEETESDSRQAADDASTINLDNNET